MSNPELLAPAGDFDSLKAAIANGADAVYLGLSDFNARGAATNFEKNNIYEAVRFAHLHGAKVYIALNTIVKDSEIPALLDTAETALLAKADAFIVQDLGVEEVLKRCFLHICLHASTQMGIHNLYGAQIAERLGITRVVLSRETKLEDIQEIKAKTNLEIEFFVQGALCVAFSGNCYMSALENNNSGNRGRCLQLCRLPYTAHCNGKAHPKSYLLSSADLCLIDNLKTLVASGVTSFKIEGRLRRAGYVATATNCYRKAIDEGFPVSNQEKMERLKKAFFRGDYIARAYLDAGVPNKIINKQDQNHIGVPIGEVKAVKPFKEIFEIEIATKHQPQAGDGLKFFEGGRQTGSIGVGNAVAVSQGRYKVYGKTRPAVGATVHLILDKAEESQALAKVKKLPVAMQIAATEGKPFALTAQYNGITVTETSQYIAQKAENAPLSPNDIIHQVSKTGNDAFAVAHTEIEAGEVFIPKSVINETRRNLFTKLTNAVIQSAEKNIKTESNHTEIDRVKKQSALYCANIVSSKDYQSFADGSGLMADEKTAVLYPRDFTHAELKRLTEDAMRQGLEPCLRLPVLTNGNDVRLLEKLLEANNQIKKVLANNLYGLAFCAKGYEVIAGWGLNIANHFALDAAFRLGAEKAIVSVECDKGFALHDKAYQFKGKGFPLMTLAHCPFKTLYGNTCADCKHADGLTYERGNKSYSLIRRKLSQCYYELTADI